MRVQDSNGLAQTVGGPAMSCGCKERRERMAKWLKEQAARIRKTLDRKRATK
jgi:hypothetical protein